MGFFNSNKEKNKYSAEATWPYSAEQVARAIQLGIPGFTVTGFNQWTNTFSLAAFPDYDVSIKIIPISAKSTSVIAEMSMHIGAMKFAGWNAEAWGNKQKIQNLMDAIIANLRRV